MDINLERDKINWPIIAIVGAGQLGSRHLQGLATATLSMEIFVVDPSIAALNIAQSRYEEVPPVSEKKITFLQNPLDLPKELDLAIIATTAQVRRKVIENILQNRTAKNFILEKVVFQRTDDFHRIKELFLHHKSEAWINCPRRMFPIYREIKKKIKRGKVEMTVIGQNWGLACNSIHMIDLFAFLTEERQLLFNGKQLENRIYDSKRLGFQELRGELSVESPKGDTLKIIDEDRTSSELIISITTDKMRYVINEAQNLASHTQKGKTMQITIKMYYQSELTGKIAEQILKKGKSHLTSYDECLVYHTQMLEAFNDHFTKITGKTIQSCPIT